MDDIWFRAPVEVGSLLYFNSQIAYTQDNYIQTRVSAEVGKGNGGTEMANMMFFECRS